MTKLLSSRQAILLLSVTMFATKIQRFQSLISQSFQQNGWIFLLLSFAIEIVFLLIVLRIFDICKDKSFFKYISEKNGKVVSGIILIMLSVFFFFKLAIPYKGVHDFFASVIFDNLKWEWFSILFLVLILFCSVKGLNAIGRTFEMCIYFIAFGFLIAIILASTTADYSLLLPIEFPNIKTMLSTTKETALWMGDFLIIFMFIGRVEKKNFKRNMIISYITVSLICIALFLVFWGVYGKLSHFQKGAMSTITEFSLIGFDLGRFDWILVLFAESSIILTSCVYTYFITDCIANTFNWKRKNIAIVVVIIIYIMDIFISPTIAATEIILTKWFCWYSLFMQTIFPIAIWIYYETLKNKKFSKISAVKQKTPQKKVRKIQ